MISRIEGCAAFVDHNYMLNRLSFTLEFGATTPFPNLDNNKGMFKVSQDMFVQAQNIAGNWFKTSSSSLVLYLYSSAELKGAFVSYLSSSIVYRVYK